MPVTVPTDCSPGIVVDGYSVAGGGISRAGTISSTATGTLGWRIETVEGRFPSGEWSFVLRDGTRGRFRVDASRPILGQVPEEARAQAVPEECVGTGMPTS